MKAFLVALLALVVVGCAQQITTTDQGSIQSRSRPTTDALLLEAVRVADNAWGIHKCRRLYIFDEGSDNGVAARGDRPGCSIYFEDDFVAEVKKLVRDGNPENAARGYILICFVATHERGHNLGYGHSKSGLMRKEMDWSAVPQACIDWAESKTRLASEPPS